MTTTPGGVVGAGHFGPAGPPLLRPPLPTLFQPTSASSEGVASTMVSFARGSCTRDANPMPRFLPDFIAFRGFIKTDLGSAKGRQYITGLCHLAPDDERHRGQFAASIHKPHRCKACVGSRRWLGLDVDGGLTATCFSRLQRVLQAYRGLIYTTASHTPDAPRCRIVVELDREVPREIFRQVSQRVRHEIDVLMGDKNIVWDDACDKPEQPLYLPLVEALFFDLDGRPISVDRLGPFVLQAPAPSVVQSPLVGESDLIAIYERDKQCDRVRAAPPGKRNDVLNAAAYALGNLIGAGRLDRMQIEQSLCEAVAEWGDSSKQLRKIQTGIASGAQHPKLLSPECQRIWRSGNEQMPRSHDDLSPVCRQGALSPLKPLSALSPLNAGSSEHEVVIQRGDRVTPEPIDWLWNGWLAIGKMHIIGGAPGCGKTTIACKLAATVTTGGCWPDGNRAPVGDVVIWSGEDDIENVLAPRMMASGADMRRVHFIAGIRSGARTVSFDPSKDLPALERALAEIPAPYLLIVDPIVSTVSGDSHKNAEVRRALQPLVDMASQCGFALVGITHFTKGTQGRDPTERITGSLAFAALARVVMVAASEDSADPPRWLLVRAKSNLGPSTGGFNYTLDYPALPNCPGVTGSRVLWGAALHGSARALLGAAEPAPQGERSSCVAEAMRWLSKALANGPLPTNAIRQAGEEAGHSFAALKRAKNRLGVLAVKFADSWGWRLPSQAALPEQGAQGAQ